MNEWNQILREDWYSQEEPDETIVEFAAVLKDQSGLKRVLDLGCGAGRHQVYMAEQGFEAHGIDTSATGLNLARKRLQDRKLEVRLVKSDMKGIPYVDSCFDAVICLHTLYHQRLAGMRETTSEIRRVLRKGGYLIVNFLSKRTYSYGKGVEVEDDTFLETEGVEKGVLHHFAGRKGVEHLLRDFKIVNMQLKEKKVEGRLRSRWIVTAMV